jgi:glucose-1-phosphate cytidylyltransferase
MRFNTAVILAGGRGSRLMEMTGECPKPLIPIGGKPIIQHIIDFYVKHGVDDFVIPVGYLGNQIFNYFAEQSDVQYNPNGTTLMAVNKKYSVTIVDTGEDTLTGSRLKMLKQYLPFAFHFTYGDGISNVNLHTVEQTFLTSPAQVVLSAVHPEPRFGSLQICHDGYVCHFGEKDDNMGYVNGGFAVLERSVLEYIPDGDDCNLERDIFPIIAKLEKMMAVKHEGWWHCIDTLRDLEKAEEMIEKGIIECAC